MAVHRAAGDDATSYNFPPHDWIDDGIKPLDPSHVMAHNHGQTVFQEHEIWDRGLSSLDHKQKFCRMATNPFSFFRGADHAFFRYSGFLRKAYPERFLKYAYDTWIQADLHTENFGTWTNSLGEVVYNINDFDESVIGDYQFDVWRMATAIRLTSRRYSLVPHEQEKKMVHAFLDGYLKGVLSFNISEKEPQSVSPEIDEFKVLVRFGNSMEKLLNKWAPVSKAFGERQFKISQKLVPASFEIKYIISQGLNDYFGTLLPSVQNDLGIRFFKVKDIAKRNLAGTGSLGSGRYYVLVEGPTDSQDDDVILDFKQQARPSPFFFLGLEFQNAYKHMFGDNDAARHNAAYHSLTRHSDPYLGYFIDEATGDTYSVRGLSWAKEAFPYEKWRGDLPALERIMAHHGVLIATDHVASGIKMLPQQHLATAIRNGMRLRERKPTDTNSFSSGAEISSALSDNVRLTGTGTGWPLWNKYAREWAELAMSFSFYYARETEKDYRKFKHSMDTHTSECGKLGAGFNKQFMDAARVYRDMTYYSQPLPVILHYAEKHGFTGNRSAAHTGELLYNNSDGVARARLSSSEGEVGTLLATQRADDAQTVDEVFSLSKRNSDGGRLSECSASIAIACLLLLVAFACRKLSLGEDVNGDTEETPRGTEYTRL